MRKEIILTVVADDRPGLVGELSGVIAGFGANWVESSMSRLGGQFAGILRIFVDEEHLGSLREALADLDRIGMTVGFHLDDHKEPPKGQPATLSMIGQDQPGMVSRVANVLRDHHVSIDVLDTLVDAGSMSGEQLFKATAQVIIPQGTSPDEIADALEEIAADLMIDIDLKEAS